MKQLKHIRNILAAHKEELRTRYHIDTIGIFGSYVRDEADEESDIDLLVEFERPIGFFKFLECEEYLSELLGAPVDLVSKKALKPYIGNHILNEVVTV